MANLGSEEIFDFRAHSKDAGVEEMPDFELEVADI